MSKFSEFLARKALTSLGEKKAPIFLKGRGSHAARRVFEIESDAIADRGSARKTRRCAPS